MRIYVPATLLELGDGRLGAAGRIAQTATAQLRRALTSAHGEAFDDEEVEYSAFLAAADTSLELLAAERAAPPRRLVLAADVPADVTGPPRAGMPGADLPGAVELRRPLAQNEIVSFHVDEATAAVTRTVAAASAGDEAARELVAEFDLLWYDATELTLVLADA